MPIHCVPSCRASTSVGKLLNGRLVSSCALVPPAPTDELVACRFCDRTFAPVRVGKHEAICEKLHSKKRPVFKSNQQRVPEECLKLRQLQNSTSNENLTNFFQNLLRRGQAGNVNSRRVPLASTRQFSSTSLSADSHGALSRTQIRNLQQRELTPEDYELLLSLDETVETKESRLNESECERLPLPSALLTWEGESCGVCLSEMEPEQEVRGLPCCSHVFHEKCIRQWLTGSKAKCPLDALEVSLD